MKCLVLEESIASVEAKVLQESVEPLPQRMLLVEPLSRRHSWRHHMGNQALDALLTRIVSEELFPGLFGEESLSDHRHVSDKIVTFLVFE